MVELIVSMAIMLIVGAAMMTFFAFCIRQYQASNEEVNLQYESQLCWSRMQEAILAADRGISVSTDTMNLYNSDETTGALKRTELYLDTTNDTIQYQEYTLTEDASTWKQEGAAQCFASYITGFTPKLMDEKGHEIDSSTNITDKPTKVEVMFSYALGEKTYETTNVVALRNHNVLATDQIILLK